MKLTTSSREIEKISNVGRTVLVGVKFDPRSRELLTWALVKVAQSGDRVIALHILNDTSEIGDRQGKSSLISLVKTFDSVLSVYEGFCNLKQVDLKLKVCRGTSARKVIVREAISYAAVSVILGSCAHHHKIRSRVSAAQYCARKLPEDFCVIAVDNGRIVFKREAIQTNPDNERHKNIVRSVHGALSKKSEMKNESTSYNENFPQSQKSSSFNRSSKRTLIKRYLSCSPGHVLPENSCSQINEESQDASDGQNSSALIPVHNLDSVSSSTESKPAWSMLQRVFFNHRRSFEKNSFLRKKPVVQWALPSQHSSAAVFPDQRQNDSDKMTLSKELKSLREKFSSTCRLFSYEELLIATSNLMPENIVGKGGSSLVYRGCLSDGKEIAVKILKPSEDILKEFVSEIEVITTLDHKNVISLFGFGFEDNNLLLVYEYLSRGSLEDNLHGNKKDGAVFGWGERYKVALGVAEALNYLHSASQPVIHRDVKSSNILLLDDFEPQLSDFGLAKWASTSSHLNCSDVAGTFGYLAPEYFMHGKVTDKIDVYAFGVVLLELLSGRKPINSDCPKGQESLVMWAKPVLKGGKISELLDSSLGSNYDHDQIEQMALAANLCIRRAPWSRPQISLVLKLLQGDEEAMNWAREQLTESDEMDGDAFPRNIQSHLNIALLDLDDDSTSISSTEQNISLEDYLQGRWSRSSSFD